MMIATTTWLIDRTTFVAVLASLVMGRANEAMRPITARVTKDGRGRHGILPGRTVLSLGALASASLAARSGAIIARKLTVQNTDSPGGAWVAGSQPLLRRMADNVIDNAVGHNVDGGWISVTTGADGAVGVLAVETGGKVLDQRQVDQLAQTFQRLGADRTGPQAGAGLGLSIVAAIADAHGGKLDLRTRPEGGLRVTIRLPLAAPATTPRAGAGL